MAIIESKFFSKELFRSVCVNVVLPLPESGDAFFGSRTLYPAAGQKYPVLYLLHGFSADHSDWARFSGIERYAQERQIAVVMPGVDNSFYCNLPEGGNYYDYYTKELPAVMESLFPISGKRENKFLAGLSMGGYGAFKAALREPGSYAAAVSLSGGMSCGAGEGWACTIGSASPDEVPTDRFMRAAFGEHGEYLKPEENDLKVLLKAAMESGGPVPLLYQACGTEDFVYPCNVEYRDYAAALGAPLTYEEGPGIHNWDFWDPYIRRAVEWLPTSGGFVD
ncbi:esterase family protein [Anaerofilum sp. BX8]|uniref:Esterase family protein n=1 Tax=Anaerofilum hominis TaxID=2763016 RepID=A0A923IBD4_9FIRM|nr:alpha/beta hydrolase family protein [Anaerofilum hominis]MBC5581803.1 esterase family protein [Anaerofilum hominis]